MTCLEARENLGAHAAGRLPLAAVLQMNQHLRHCAWCRERYELILDQERHRLTSGSGRAAAQPSTHRRGCTLVRDRVRRAFRSAAGWAGAAAGFLFAVAFLYAASQWRGARHPEPLPVQASAPVRASARTVPPAETRPPAPTATTVLVEPAVNPVESAPRKRTRRPPPKPAAPAPAAPPPADPASPGALLEPLQLARMELPLGRFASVLEPPAPTPPQKVAVISGLGPEPVSVPISKPPRPGDLPEAAVIIHNLGPDPVVLPVRRQPLPTLARAGQ